MKINFQLGPAVSWCQCKFVPGWFENAGKEEVSVFYFCIILSCFPVRRARGDLEVGLIFRLAHLLTMDWYLQHPPPCPCWLDFSLMICELTSSVQALDPNTLWSLALLMLGWLGLRAIVLHTELYLQRRPTLTTMVLPVHYHPVWHWMCVLSVCPLEAKCHSTKITFCPIFLPFQNGFKLSVWVNSIWSLRGIPKPRMFCLWSNPSNVWNFHHCEFFLPCKI